ALEALERNDISRLPGGLFSRAFVRAYAREAGLDVEEAVRRFVARFPEASGEEGPVPYEPNPDHIPLDEQPSVGRGWRAVGWALPILLVIAYFGFGGRVHFWSEKLAPSTPAVVEQPAVPPPPPAAAQGLPIVPPPEEVAAVPPEAVQPAGGEVAAPPVAAAPVEQAGGAPAGATGSEPPQGTLRLTLAPSEDCWVSVRADGVSVFAGMLTAGTRRDFDVTGDISLSVGNAGAMTFAINGQPARPLGDRGQVRTVRFGPGNFRELLEPR
ncbi:MAG: helix-turn-helix domain-containing protein, partial [Acidobacteria bacterium]